jgi:RNA polymerase sigma-70 factor (family 1)
MLPEYKQHSDEELLRSLRNDDESAFSEIYQRYSPVLFKTAYNILKHRSGAEDVVQEIFISLWNKRTNHNIQSLGGYLNQSTWYYALRIYREGKRDAQFQQRLADVSQLISIEDPAAYRDLQSILQKIIAQLPPEHQLIYKFSREQNMTYREIAQHLGISVKTVEKKMSDALKHIRLSMGQTLILLGFFINQP